MFYRAILTTQTGEIFYADNGNECVAAADAAKRADNKCNARLVIYRIFDNMPRECAYAGTLSKWEIETN